MQKSSKVIATDSIICNWNELLGMRMHHKQAISSYYKDYHQRIEELNKLELMDRCYIARLRELYPLLKHPNLYDAYATTHEKVYAEISKINILRNVNKRDRKAVISDIKSDKRMIQKVSTRLRSLHNAITKAMASGKSHKYRQNKYKVTILDFEDRTCQLVIETLKPIQAVICPQN